MTFEELFSRIGGLEEQYIRFWEDICSLESPTADKARVDAVGRLVKERAAALGWTVEEQKEPVSGDPLCLTMNPDAPGRPVCFSAHMDTVHAVGSFGSPAVTKDDTYIYGPGVMDCKGGIAAAFLAMEALQQGGFAGRPVKLILQSDEETSSRGSGKRTVAFMAEKARGCAAFLNLEGHAAIRNRGDGTEGGEQTCVLQRKGIARYRLTVHGHSVHSANCIMGVNAAAEAARKLLELEKIKSADGLTCNCSCLQSTGAANVVPELCTFTADFRFPDEAGEKEAAEAVRRIAETSFLPGSSCEAELVSRRAAMPLCERNLKLLAEMNRVWRDAGLPEQAAGFSAGGSDAADMTAAGIPTVDSIGVDGNFIHSVRERARICSLAECAKRIGTVALCLPDTAAD